MPPTEVPLVEKVFRVLEVLAAEREPLPLSDIARKAGIPRPTVHRLLNHLNDLGYVGKDERFNRWFPGLRLAQLQPRGDYEALKRAAIPCMRNLHTKFNETINLGVLSAGRIYYLLSFETTRPLRWVAQPHQTDDFHSTALGRAIVSHLPKAERETLLEPEYLAQHTDQTVIDREVLKKILNETRERGWSKEDGENDYDVVCLGVPLLSDGYPLGAISLSLPRTRLTPELEASIIKELLNSRELA